MIDVQLPGPRTSRETPRQIDGQVNAELCRFDQEEIVRSNQRLQLDLQVTDGQADHRAGLRSCGLVGFSERIVVFPTLMLDLDMFDRNSVAATVQV